jgi:hypothetical protein
MKMENFKRILIAACVALMSLPAIAEDYDGDYAVDRAQIYPNPKALCSP